MMKNKHKATVYDVAKEAGTSVATVSRVFGNTGYPVSQEMRARVMSAAQQLEYAPADRGQPVAADGTEIGIIVPNVSNPYFWQIVMGVEHEMVKRGGSIFLCNSSRNPAAELRYLKSLMKKGIHGILLASVATDREEIADLQRQGLRMVILDQSAGDVECSKVGFNYLKGGTMAVEHLIEMGHRRIAFVSAPLLRESRNQTLSGYKLGLMNAMLPLRPEYVLIMDSEENADDGDYEYNIGRASVEQLLSLTPRPTAVFCLNDMIALGVIATLEDKGLRVPEDMSVVGFDNIQAAGMCRPALTTISQPAYEIGRIAYKILMDTLSGASPNRVELILEPELIVRNSVRRIEEADEP